MAEMRGALDQGGTLSPPSAAMRFEVLDSWRGLCALLVTLFHFPTASAVSQSAFAASAYLFVDFFFVLSGFVIVSSYAGRIADTNSAGRFAIVRFGRVYPLHLLMILAFAAFELLRLALPQLRGSGGEPFTGGFDLGSLATNLLLLQGIGFEDQLTWNSPSWSISAEFFTYLLFAAVMLAASRRAWMVFAAIAVVAPAAMLISGAPNMDLTYHLGFLRCLFGFSLGGLIAWFQHDAIVAERQSPLLQGNRMFWTTAEIAMIIAIFLFVSGAGDERASIAAPLVFAVALYLFAHEGGLVSTVLRSKPFLLLGALSYSIYMVHLFVQARMYNVAALVDRKLGIGLVGDIIHHGTPQPGFGPGSSWIGAVAIVAMIAATIAVSYVTWRFVEMPALAWFRKLASGKQTASSTARAFRLPSVGTVPTR